MVATTIHNGIGDGAAVVSIIVPIYNVERYLRDCLDSILAQTYQHIEVVMVNDGSPDNSVTIASEYAEKYAWTLISQENRGLSEARHTGLKHATGAYILFVDSDDLIAPTTVERALKELVANQVDIVLLGFREFSDSDSPFDDADSQQAEKEHETLIVSDPLQYHLAPQPKPFPILAMTAWGKLYKTELLADIDWDLINFKINEDESFICYPYMRAQNGIAIVDAQLCYYRKHANSITQSAYRNTYQGKELTKLEFLKLLRNVQQEILGEANSHLVLNYYVSGIIQSYSRDLLAINNLAHSTNDTDMQQFITDLNENIDAYLDLPATLTIPYIREYATAFKTNGFTGFIQHMHSVQHAIHQYELEQRDSAFIARAAEIEMMRSSRSWRWTRPLRWLYTKLQGDPHQLKQE